MKPCLELSEGEAAVLCYKYQGNCSECSQAFADKSVEIKEVKTQPSATNVGTITAWRREMSELRECPYVKKYLALEWMSDTQPMPDGSKVFATKEECLAFVQGHPHFKEFPDVRWTIVTVYDTSPTESALRKRVGELEGVIQPLMDELHELYGQHGYGGESLPMINARLALAPQKPTPPEMEASDE